ncbi:hypothetical protein QR680_018153 [Steinernema hermaphroditum]|uniref:SRR1-like domain-containing protein n=1 Tax=Steinernema hermaphroditum TaxID=289476 RepID=A0AA39HH14_9BILA|nr:hypothetical protein QR680_018153 [Steinernema hermaphroditum]
MAISLALQKRLHPKETVFEDSGFSEEEMEYLNGRGVSTAQVSEYLTPTEDPPSAGEVDIFYTAHCNAAVFDTLLWSRWSDSWLQRSVFLMADGQMDFDELQYYNHFQHPGHFERVPLFRYFLPEVNTDYRPVFSQVCAFSLQMKSVESGFQKPTYFWNMTPNYLKSFSTGGLVEMENFDQIEQNLQKIRQRFEKEGFLEGVASDVDKILRGRKVKRVRLVGVGNFAFHFAIEYLKFIGLQQLLLALSLGEQFNAPVVCHEPVFSLLERGYLESIGVETPPTSDMSLTEEDLLEQEVTLFYMPRCPPELVNMVLWANRKQMRSIVLIGNDQSSNRKFYKAIENYEKRAEKVPVRNLNLGYPTHLSTDGYATFHSSNAPFQGTMITSYPARVLEGVGDSKPLHTNVRGVGMNAYGNARIRSAAPVRKADLDFVHDSSKTSPTEMKDILSKTVEDSKEVVPRRQKCSCSFENPLTECQVCHKKLPPVTETIKVSVVGEKKNVALIELNRSEFLNALTDQLINELSTSLDHFDEDKSIGTVVITGSERAFSIGSGGKAMVMRDFACVFKDRYQDGWTKDTRVRKPVIAAVNGFALGKGYKLAMMCDIIYAGDKAFFGQPEINIETIPGDGGTQSHVVGKSLAMEMCLTGNRISAQEAKESGLVAKIFPTVTLVDEAIKLGERISDHSPLIVQIAKEAVNSAYASWDIK